jgi:hypothetical protein
MIFLGAALLVLVLIRIGKFWPAHRQRASQLWRRSGGNPLCAPWAWRAALEVLRCCSGVASVLSPWVSLVQPLYNPCTSLVHPLCTRGDFGGPTVSPPSPALVLTAMVRPLFKGNRIFP